MVNFYFSLPLEKFPSRNTFPYFLTYIKVEKLPARSLHQFNRSKSTKSLLVFTLAFEVFPLI